MKRALIVLILLVLVCGGVRMWLDHIGAGIAADSRARVARELEADQARTAALRLPAPLSGDATDGNAADALWPLFDRAADWTDLAQDLPPPAPGAPLSATVSAILAAHEADLAAVSSALRATRCDWKVDLEKGFNAKLPSAIGGRRVGILLRAAALEREARGDVAGAAARCVDAVRLAAMVGTGPSLVEAMSSNGIDAPAERLLAQILTSPAGAGMPLDAIDAQLAALEALFPDPQAAIRDERLCLGLVLIQGATGEAPFKVVKLLNGVSDRSMLVIVLPPRFLLARTLLELDERYSSFENDLGALDRAAADARFTAYTAEVEASWNPLVRGAVINLQGVFENGVHVHERLTRQAIAIERRRRADGRYPATIEDKDLPLDPLARPARLRYESLEGGRGYRISSAGHDGKPATSDDIVVERTPAK